MIISIHQPLFIPWFPYFEKMAQSDLFIFMTTCQYEKGSCLNRNKINGSWWTKPIKSGTCNIVDKIYSDGQNLVEVNVSWIDAIRKTLNIKTPIRFDFETDKKKTARIIEICKFYKADQYLAAEEAPNKYLDVNELKDNGIEFIPFKSEYKKSTFEMFHEFGIEKCCGIIKNGRKKLEEKLKSIKKEDTNEG